MVVKLNEKIIDTKCNCDICMATCVNCGCARQLHDIVINGKCDFCVGHPSSNKECPGYETDLEDNKRKYQGEARKAFIAYLQSALYVNFDLYEFWNQLSYAGILSIYLYDDPELLKIIKVD